MTTVTLTLDDAAAEKAMQAAQRRHTSLEEMLMHYVASLSQDDSDATSRDGVAQGLEATFRLLSRPLGGKGYISRDELHER